MTKARDIASAAPAPSTVSATELGYLDGVSSAIQTQLDAKTAKSTLTTTGDIYYASSANTPARLGIGSTGNVLTVASGIPSWAAPAGGKVLQVVQTTKLNTFSTNSTSFTDITDLSVSITPASASNKVLVFAFTNGSTTGSTAMINLVRDSTAIFQPSGSPSLPSVANVTSGSSDRNVSATISFLDSPSTTSATTYKVQIKMESGTQTVYVNRRADSADHAYTSSIIAMEIGA
jgi:hypothetical protein